MEPRLDNATSADRIEISLLFHLPNPCGSNHHHHCHKRGGMSGVTMLFATPAATATATVAPSMALTATTELKMTGIGGLDVVHDYVVGMLSIT